VGKPQKGTVPQSSFHKLCFRVKRTECRLSLSCWTAELPRQEWILLCYKLNALTGATLKTCLCMGSDAIMPCTLQCMSSCFFLFTGRLLGYFAWSRYKMIKEVYSLYENAPGLLDTEQHSSKSNFFLFLVCCK